MLKGYSSMLVQLLSKLLSSSTSLCESPSGSNPPIATGFFLYVARRVRLCCLLVRGRLVNPFTLPLNLKMRFNNLFDITAYYITQNKQLHDFRQNRVRPTVMRLDQRCMLHTVCSTCSVLEVKGSRSRSHKLTSL